MSTNQMVRPDLTKEEAQDLTQRIRDRVSELLPLITEAWERSAWAALGYASWFHYCDAELQGMRLPVGERRQAVTALRETGMSTRAIGSALGVGATTVHRDLGSTVPNGTVDVVTGVNGKRYESVQPTRDRAKPKPAAWPPPEPVDDDWPPIDSEGAGEPNEEEVRAQEVERLRRIEQQEHEESLERDRDRIRSVNTGWSTVRAILADPSAGRAKEIVAGLGEGDQQALQQILAEWEGQRS